MGVVVYHRANRSVELRREFRVRARTVERAGLAALLQSSRQRIRDGRPNVKPLQLTSEAVDYRGARQRAHWNNGRSLSLRKRGAQQRACGKRSGCSRHVWRCDEEMINTNDCGTRAHIKRFSLLSRYLRFAPSDL